MMTWTDDMLDAARQRTDPPADALVATLVAEQGLDQARALFDTLIRQVDLPLAELPAPMADFVRIQGQLPPWADARLLRRAETVFLDHGPKFLLYLYYLSLPTLYACAKGAQVLYLTGRLMPSREGHARFSRRIAETGQFLLDVMTPGGLRPGGQGIQTTLRVRLIHAAIRHFIPATQWDPAWGRPINQEDMAITLQTFAVCMFRGLARTGIDLSPADAAAYYHAWRVVGHLLGLEPALVPETPAGGEALLDRILARQAAPSEAGQALTRALVTFAEETTPGKSFDQAPRILIRHLAGPELTRMLDAEPRRGCLFFSLPLFMRQWLGWIERWEDLSLPGHLLMTQLSSRLVEGMVNFFNEEKGHRFQIPPAVRQAWRV